MNNKILYLPFMLGMVCTPYSAFAAKECPPALSADEPIIANSMEQSDINGGALDFDTIVKHGAALFSAVWNTCDGQGRPATTGGGAKRSIPTFSDTGEAISAGQITKLRTSAPDSDSCAGCHSSPEAGGAGDFVANVFVLAQTLDPVTLSVSPSKANSRNTLGMHGAGAIEMLTREMTVDLQTQAAALSDGSHTLITKGVDFDIEIAGGVVVAADGVDTNLIVKPFHQSGAQVSLRGFTTGAMNHHHGMQAEELFDMNPAKGYELDFDEDGVERELTVGDLTAISLFQAQLATPQQVLPKSKKANRVVENGEKVFNDIGCASCHTPEMVLNSRDFVEPNPNNTPGTCSSAAEGCPDYAFDLTDEAGLTKGPGGTAIVRAYSDLKRHSLCDTAGPGAIRHFCNEQLSMGRPDQDDKSGTEFFLTRKLWDVGNTAPYGHRGDITTITEAILLHGGEGRVSRDAFEASASPKQKALVTFLKTLQIVP